MKHSENSMFSSEKDNKFLKELLKNLEKTQLTVDGVELKTIISKAVDSGASEAATHLLNQLKATAPKMLKKRRKDMIFFEQRLNKLWRKPFDLLEMFLVMSYEAGEAFNEEMRPEAAKSNDLVFDALTRLHARGCQIAGEILTLLRSGYAAGAHARWRTLHEIAIVAFFIKQHGNKVAERYILHNDIESYKALLEYKKHSSALGYPSCTKEEVEKAITLRNQLCKKFGKSFSNNYGWAAEVLKNPDPSLSDLEERVNLDHLRPFYRMASHAVHANPKGITFNLGLLGTEGVLLAGPSNVGMADPGHATAISLQQVNTALLTTKPSLQVIVVLRTMKQLVDEIGKTFLEVDTLLKTQTKNQPQSKDS